MLTVNELVAAARGRGVNVSELQVREWTRDGYLPSPTRAPLPGQGRGRAPYRYPDGALGAVTLLARWRRALPADPTQVRVWLWLMGVEELEVDPDGYYRDWLSRKWADYRRENPALPVAPALMPDLDAAQIDAIYEAHGAGNPDPEGWFFLVALALYGIVSAADLAHLDRDNRRERGRSLLQEMYRLAGTTGLNRAPSIMSDAGRHIATFDGTGEAVSLRDDTVFATLAALGIPRALHQSPDWPFIRAGFALLVACADGRYAEMPTFVAGFVRWLLALEPGYAMLAFSAGAATLRPEIRSALVALAAPALAGDGEMPAPGAAGSPASGDGGEG